MDLAEYVPGLPIPAWERARGRAFVDILRKRLSLERAQLVDYGCGDGFVTNHIAYATGAEVAHGYDPALTPELLSHLAPIRPNVRLVSSPEHLPPGPELLLMLDVLEHVPSDGDFLMEVLRTTHPRWLLVAVPAHPALFGPHDQFLGHYRRYTHGGLQRLLRSCSLEVLASGALFPSLIPMRVLENLRFKMRPSAASEYRAAASWPLRGWVDQLAELVLVADNRVFGRLPGFGLTLWALCR